MSTHQGDGGKSLVKNREIAKDSKLLAAIGDLDELMAVVAIVGQQVSDVGIIGGKINKEVFWISGYLAGYNEKVDLKESVRLMEQDIVGMEKEMGKIEKFLKAGEQLNVWFNWARVVARRAERSVVALSKEQKIDESVLIFMNRLSLYLFWLGRRVR